MNCTQSELKLYLFISIALEKMEVSISFPNSYSISSSFFPFDIKQEKVPVISSTLLCLLQDPVKARNRTTKVILLERVSYPL